MFIESEANERHAHTRQYVTMLNRQYVVMLNLSKRSHLYGLANNLADTLIYQWPHGAVLCHLFDAVGFAIVCLGVDFAFVEDQKQSLQICDPHALMHVVQPGHDSIRPLMGKDSENRFDDSLLLHQFVGMCRIDLNTSRQE